MCDIETGRRRIVGGLLYWPFLLIHVVSYSGPHTAILLLGRGRGGTASLWLLAIRSPWLTVTARKCDWPSDVGSRVYIISHAHKSPVVNQFPAVNPRELFTSTHRSLPVYIARRRRLCQMSICNMQHSH